MCFSLDPQPSSCLSLLFVHKEIRVRVREGIGRVCLQLTTCLWSFPPDAKKGAGKSFASGTHKQRTHEPPAAAAAAAPQPPEASVAVNVFRHRPESPSHSFTLPSREQETMHALPPPGAAAAVPSGSLTEMPPLRICRGREPGGALSL